MLINWHFCYKDMCCVTNPQVLYVILLISFLTKFLWVSYIHTVINTWDFFGRLWRRSRRCGWRRDRRQQWWRQHESGSVFRLLMLHRHHHRPLTCETSLSSPALPRPAQGNAAQKRETRAVHLLALQLNDSSNTCVLLPASSLGAIKVCNGGCRSPRQGSITTTCAMNGT